MDKHQILTEEELAMLRDLGDAQDTVHGQFLRGYLDLPLLSLLQRADQLVLETRIAGHQLRFPLHAAAGEEGYTELRIAAPAISELGYPHPRAWRLDEQARLQTADAEYAVHSLSLGGLIAEGLPSTLVKGDLLNGTLHIEGLHPLPITGTLIRRIHSHQERHDWALQFQLTTQDQEQLGDWLFQRHQDIFTRAYQPD